MKSSDLLKVDELWTDTEMIDNGLSQKLARGGVQSTKWAGGMIENLSQEGSEESFDSH